MTTQNDTDLQELKTLINDRFNQLDRKLDETKAEFIFQILQTKSELKQELNNLNGDIKAGNIEIKGLDKRISLIEISIAKIPEITEKFGELKNW